jgi:DNA ligase-associated metallophosphoesterase
MPVKESHCTFALREEEFLLLPEKAIFWKNYNILLIADLHLGKVSHFRKAGIPVPRSAKRATLDKVEDLLLRYLPSQIMILGDLFHSEYNQAWLAFNDLLERYLDVEFILVEGNHDILEKSLYENSRLTVIPGLLQKPPFIFSHEPLETVHEGLYNLCGHIHPGVKMVGKARQSMRLPCFYFGDNTGILPAFGTFTGCATIQPLKGESVFVVGKDQVLCVQ